MKKFAEVVCRATLLFALGFTAEAAPLPSGTRLGLDTGIGSASHTPCVMGSCVGLEVVPGFMAWSNITAGTDGGMVTNKNQQPKEMVQTVGLLGFYNYFNFTTAPQDTSLCASDAAANLFDNVSCQGADCLGKTELGTLHMTWSLSCYPVGSRAGCTNARCTPEQQAGIFVKDYYIDLAGGRWRLKYDQVVPNGTLQGLKFSAILGGLLTGGGAPAAGDARLSLNSGATATWTPTVSDPNNDTLSCRLGRPPAVGTAKIASNCSTASYTAPANFVGTQTFTYIASDGKFDSNPGDVVATVAAVPTPLPAGAPIAMDISNATCNYPSGSWTPQVSDPDNGPNPLTCRIDRLPAYGIATVAADCSTGSYSVLPTVFLPLGGGDGFTYIASDGLYDSKPAAVSVWWTELPPPPYAGDVSISGVSGQVLVWKPDARNIYACQPLSCYPSSPPANGIATVAVDCSAGTYQSKPGFIGADSFSYVASNNGFYRSYATVTVAVTEPGSDDACTRQYPISLFSQTGKDGTLTISFTGNITSHANKEVKVCPGTTLKYQASSTKGPVVCKVKNNTTRGSGSLKINDHLKCTDKPAGKDKVGFKVKSGVSN